MARWLITPFVPQNRYNGSFVGCHAVVRPDRPIKSLTSSQLLVSRGTAYQSLQDYRSATKPLLAICLIIWRWFCLTRAEYTLDKRDRQLSSVRRPLHPEAEQRKRCLPVYLSVYVAACLSGCLPSRTYRSSSSCMGHDISTCVHCHRFCQSAIKLLGLGAVLRCIVAMRSLSLYPDKINHWVHAIWGIRRICIGLILLGCNSYHL